MNVAAVFAGSGSPVVVGIGGSGGIAGDAGDVTVVRGQQEDPLADWIITSGESAIGIEASSIGGGGGDAGMNFIASGNYTKAEDPSGTYSLQLGIGGSADSGGKGGTVDVHNRSSIITRGTTVTEFSPSLSVAVVVTPRSILVVVIQKTRLQQRLQLEEAPVKATMEETSRWITGA
ncbi:hypothetical protein [Prosthecochloris sp. HL-130-GSB]|uniref:hypothetical protein n=1 Tax=Prosthecochloris sp. HL-130-GSB TaxID=1974213 RepID=UPI000A1BFF76|nr:hypothetical protein [Prosthecochloris sp. HL-130-GSB]ARM31388.1 hypothetical protein B9H02_08895 [Prosthecochloris sp. HL-130-GSB]